MAMQPFVTTQTLRAALNHLRRNLQHQGLSAEDARREAFYLAESALDLSPLDCLTRLDAPLAEFPNHDRLFVWIKNRLKGQPLSRLKGQRAFWKHTFNVTTHTLDPRPETEHIIEAVLEHFPTPNLPLRILDLGTGTGCILLSLLHEYPKATGLGCDLCPQALAIARQNGSDLNVTHRAHFTLSHWFDALDRTQHPPFDVIVSNPPYIPTKIISTLEPSVKNFDPILALDGGTDGLEAYRALIPQAPGFLRPKGLLVLEMGIGQATDLVTMAQPFFHHVTTIKDLSQHSRVLLCHTPARL
jgi:release factor glutamine methyltransferase